MVVICLMTPDVPRHAVTLLTLSLGQASADASYPSFSTLRLTSAHHTLLVVVFPVLILVFAKMMGIVIRRERNRRTARTAKSG